MKILIGSYKALYTSDLSLESQPILSIYHLVEKERGDDRRVVICLSTLVVFLWRAALGGF